jgi:hypothetical protein
LNYLSKGGNNLIELNNEEMLNVKGGAITTKLLGALGAVIIFAIGVVDGLIHPKKC